MAKSVAIMGLRHGHIYDLIAHVKAHADLQLVAVCEEDAKTRDAFVARATGETVFASYAQMLNSVECDIIGVGDYFGKRGAIILEALKCGKHVISDKPICTSLQELAAITTAVEESGLKLGCQFDIRDHGNFRALRKIIRAGEIGAVKAIGFDGHHPLLVGTRADWYFEAGKHGGTINDVAVHAFDFIPWITGHEFSTLNCARTWNTVPTLPHFQDAAQMMLTLENGCGVMGDVSYFAPDSHGYNLPQYWRIALWGSEGVADTNFNRTGVMLHKNGESQPRLIPALEAQRGGYLRHFLAEINGQQSEGALTTRDVLRASSVALQTQLGADTNLAHTAFNPIETAAKEIG